jgi:hypothetical protein
LKRQCKMCLLPTIFFMLFSCIVLWILFVFFVSFERNKIKNKLYETMNESKPRGRKLFLPRELFLTNSRLKMAPYPNPTVVLIANDEPFQCSRSDTLIERIMSLNSNVKRDSQMASLMFQSKSAKTRHLIQSRCLITA